MRGHSLVFSPHAWGWSGRICDTLCRLGVLPTRVGMVRLEPWLACIAESSPHTRGDGPEWLQIGLVLAMFSPHAWGWSVTTSTNSTNNEVLPTRVGMVRQTGLGLRVGRRSPHTRGDGPTLDCSALRLSLFSPHAWGWSARRGCRQRPKAVLPTRVGMVQINGFRRAFPFPFSPHAWGWSDNGRGKRLAETVLPTRVGMVRRLVCLVTALQCSPHTRGDGPQTKQRTFTMSVFSPHAWGWSV